MERKSKSEIKKMLEQMKNPQSHDEHGVAAGGKNLHAPKVNAAKHSSIYRPKT